MSALAVVVLAWWYWHSLSWLASRWSEPKDSVSLPVARRIRVVTTGLVVAMGTVAVLALDAIG